MKERKLLTLQEKLKILTNVDPHSDRYIFVSVPL